MPKTVKIVAALALVGLICSACADGNPLPFIVMVAVGWVTWQVAKGFGAGS